MEIDVKDIINSYKKKVGDLEHDKIILQLQIEKLYKILKENNIEII